MFYGGGHRGAIVESILGSLPRNQRIYHIHGEPGSGKTMLALVLSDRLKHRCHTIRYDVPQISAAKLLRHLLIELCPQNAHLISPGQAQEGADRASIEAAIACIEKQVMSNQCVEHNKPYALFIDSAGEIGVEALRVIEKLSSLRYADRAAMHCLVFHTVTKDVCSFVTAVEPDVNHFWLRKLTLAEIDEYLRHHMMLFDYNRRNLFTREMAYFIADRSEGVFRSINTLARNAFTIANLEDADKLSMSHLLMAGLPVRSEVQNRSGFASKYRLSVVALMATCVVGLMAMAVVLLK